MREDLQGASLAELHFRALEDDDEAKAAAAKLTAEREIRALELAIRAARKAKGTPTASSDSSQSAPFAAPREHRTGAVDRRSDLPWRKGSPGRRWEDELRRDLA